MFVSLIFFSPENLNNVKWHGVTKHDLFLNLIKQFWCLNITKLFHSVIHVVLSGSLIQTLMRHCGCHRMSSQTQLRPVVLFGLTHLTSFNKICVYSERRQHIDVATSREWLLIVLCCLFFVYLNSFRIHQFNRDIKIWKTRYCGSWSFLTTSIHHYESLWGFQH